MANAKPTLQYWDINTEQWVELELGGQGGQNIERNTQIIFEVFKDFEFTSDNVFTCKHIKQKGSDPVVYNGVIEQEGNITKLLFRTNFTYRPGNNQIEVILDDTFFRAPATGGIEEVNDQEFYLLEEDFDPNEFYKEISVKYYTLVNTGASPNVYVSNRRPNNDEYGDMFQNGDLWVKY